MTLANFFRILEVQCNAPRLGGNSTVALAIIEKARISYLASLQIPPEEDPIS